MLQNLSGANALKVHEAIFIVFEVTYRWSHSLGKVLTGFVVVSLHDSQVHGRGRLRDGPLSLGGVAFGAARAHIHLLHAGELWGGCREVHAAVEA